MSDRNEISTLLDQAARLTGQKRVMLRCDTEIVETVYIERRQDDVMVHDRGETWFRIVTYPECWKPWNDDQVQRLAEQRGVTVEAEPLNEEHDEVVRVSLNRILSADEGLADAVAQLADLIDAIGDCHSVGGGWRGDDA